MGRLSIVVLMLLFYFSGKAQCVQSNFAINGQSTPSVACPLQAVNIDNQSTNAVRYEWDFCAGDMAGTPVGTVAATLSTIQTFDAIRIVKQSTTQYYGFIVKQASGGLFRLNYGSDITQQPVVESLGTLGLSGATDIEFIENNGIWYAFVASGSNIIRLKFTAGLGGTGASITSTNLGNFGGLISNVRGIALARDGSNFYVLATSSTLNTLTVIRFAGSPEGTTTTANIAVAGSASLLAISAFKECNTWYGIMTSPGNSRLIKVQFGADLMATSSFQFTTQSGVSIQSFGMDMTVENGQYYVFLVTIGTPAILYQLNYGTSIWSNNPAVVNRSSLSGLANSIAMDFFVNNSQVVGFVGNRTNYQLHRISYPNDCKTNIASSALEDPVGVLYTASGNFPVELKAFDNDDNFVSIVKTLTVSALPTVAFSSNKNCAGASTLFADETIPGGVPITSWSWDFGGLGTSTEQNPGYEFPAPSNYNVTLEVTDSRGCQRSLNQNVKIYSNTDIVPDFAPPALICSGGATGFSDASTFIEDEIVAWNWEFNNGEGSSNDQHAAYQFNHAGSNDVSLTVTGKSGCLYSVEKQVNAVEGPVVDFLFTGKCEDQEVQFVENIDEPITDYSWDFQHGPSSSQDNPVHIFTDPGTYQVTLTALSPSGCNTSVTKPVTIYTVASVNFSIKPPPLSCSGSLTPFIDLTPDPTDSDIATWQWNFGDPGSANNTSPLINPGHTFANAGTYDVSLTVQTDQGCASSTVKNIAIVPSPTATIENTPTCKGLPVNFLASGANISGYYWEVGTLYYEVPDPTHTFNTAGNFPMRLTVTGSNSCQTVYNKVINVPVPLTADFSVTKNCAGSDALFADLTTGVDPVVQRSWDFAGEGTGSGASPVFQFNAAGNKLITLQVVSHAGCQYTTAKTIQVSAPPVADFTSLPEPGAATLPVQFTNASTGAIAYSWTFGDGSGTSTLPSPAYSFSTEGEYTVELTAIGAQGCENRQAKTVTVVTPLPDVDLKLITITENADGTLKIIVTIHNKGNTLVTALPVVIDISGETTLTETLKEPVLPASQYNLVLNYGINVNDDLKFLCASIDLPNDLTPEGNRICKELGGQVSLFTAYPNPAVSTLKIGWVAPREEVVAIVLVDSFGKKVLERAVASTEGLNTAVLDVSRFRDGIYFLVLNGGSVRSAQRVLISGQN